MSEAMERALLVRIQELEAARHRMRWGLSALGLLLAALVVVQARPRGRITAERFDLVDRQGKVRATLALRDGEPGLSLLDRRGGANARLTAHEDRSASLDFFGRDGLQMTLGGGARGPEIQLLDDAHRLAAGLYVRPEGTSGLALNRPEQGGVRLAVDEGGGALIGLSDGRGTPRGGWHMTSAGRVTPLAVEHPATRRFATMIDAPTEAEPVSTGVQPVAIPAYYGVAPGVRLYAP